MKLVVYGDFNCPYSCLASVRVDALLAAGAATVNWRAVEHDPRIPAPSEPVAGDLARELDREIDEIRGMLRAGEGFPMRRPPRRPNTAAATMAYSGAAEEHRHELRTRLFAALWFDGTDIGDREVVRNLGGDATASDDDRIARWRSGWLAIPRVAVPTLVLDDGSPVVGRDALAMLGELAVRG